MLCWWVESLFHGSGGALFGLCCSLDIRSDGGCHRISFAALLLLSVRSNVNYPRYVSAHCK